jgi:hypothetical protein
MQDFANAGGRNAQRQSQRVGREAQRLKVFLAQDFTRVDGSYFVCRHFYYLNDNQ